jgi:glycosyltransferase involved in cell wall biosynthesis
VDKWRFLLNMSDMVSVIVPHHNRPDFLRDALLSIRDQTAKPAEVIVVDDDSKPEYRDRLREFAGLASILHTPANIGLSAARNFGAQHAKGEWLAFLDDDDVFLPDKIERQLQYLKGHPECEALGGGLTMVSPDGRKEYWGSRRTGPVTLADALHYTASMAQALMIRRDVFLKLGGFETRLRALEDYDFGIRVVASGCVMHFLAEPLFLYRLGGREQMSLEFGRMLRANIEVLHRHRALCRREFGPFGYIRLNARCFKERGLRRGGVAGRSVWAAGCVLEGLFGRQPGEYD